MTLSCKSSILLELYTATPCSSLKSLKLNSFALSYFELLGYEYVVINWYKMKKQHRFLLKKKIHISGPAQFQSQLYISKIFFFQVSQQAF